jgi:nicotinamidase-related amidase
VSAPPGPGAALLTIDVQRGFHDPSWGRRNNPDLETHVAALHAAWRAARRPLIHVRHASRKPDSPLRAGQPGHEFMAEAAPRLGETVIAKTVHSAFIGTPLQRHLDAGRVRELVLCGIQTNYCVATTARMAGNLGYRVWVAGDACATFGQKGLDGKAHSAQLLHDVALMELEGEFATVASTRGLVAGSK